MSRGEALGVISKGVGFGLSMGASRKALDSVLAMTEQMKKTASIGAQVEYANLEQQKIQAGAQIGQQQAGFAASGAGGGASAAMATNVATSGAQTKYQLTEQQVAADYQSRILSADAMATSAQQQAFGGFLSGLGNIFS